MKDILARTLFAHGMTLFELIDMTMSACQSAPVNWSDVDRTVCRPLASDNQKQQDSESEAYEWQGCDFREYADNYLIDMDGGDWDTYFVTKSMRCLSINGSEVHIEFHNQMNLRVEIGEDGVPTAITWDNDDPWDSSEAVFIPWYYATYFSIDDDEVGLTDPIDNDEVGLTDPIDDDESVYI